MGGILCATPAWSIVCIKTIPRLRRLPSATSRGKFGHIPLKHFNKHKSLGLKAITIKDLEKENATLEKSNVFLTDMLWYYGKHVENAKVTGWNSFIERVTLITAFEKSKKFLFHLSMKFSVTTTSFLQC